jgi:hypothetical protein
VLWPRAGVQGPVAASAKAPSELHEQDEIPRTVGAALILDERIRRQTVEGV